MRDGDRVVVPLHGQARLRGALAVVPSPDAAAEPLDLDVLGAVGQQTGLALDRALLYEHTADVARELQHSLLAVDPPPDPRFAVAAIYRPGVEMLEVGGDWYDTFVVSRDLLAVVVGDVVGRGLGAASAMGQLRSAVRAVADPGVGPARLLERLDRFVEQVEAASMATLAYAELDLATGEFRYACAGHPPPVLLPAGRSRGRPTPARACSGTAAPHRWAPTGGSPGWRPWPGSRPATACCSTPTGWWRGATGGSTSGSPSSCGSPAARAASRCRRPSGRCPRSCCGTSRAGTTPVRCSSNGGSRPPAGASRARPGRDIVVPVANG